MKKRILFIILFMLFQFPLSAQTADKIEVMTVGTFHFDFPNRDVVKIMKGDQIDVLNPKYQAEIKAIADRLAAFEPTIIAVEKRPEEQSEIDALYQKYLRDEHDLGRPEYQQIGFRLAKKLKHNKVYAVDEWGKHYERLEEVLSDSVKSSEFEYFYFDNPDSSLKYTREPVFATKGIAEELVILNQPEKINQDLGNYLIGHFKFESEEYDYTGTDFETGRWFNRNLRIFRNIQRIQAKPQDRILVIFGAGHLNLLNIFFEASPEYTLISPLEYLEK